MCSILFHIQLDLKINKEYYQFENLLLKKHLSKDTDFF